MHTMRKRQEARITDVVSLNNQRTQLPSSEIGEAIGGTRLGGKNRSSFLDMLSLGYQKYKHIH